ncbi:MAG: hypothetical protein EXR69_09750 [Myxococcales bacterium]|nr:hypothetical protein [Myxococcales bacterium]
MTWAPTNSERSTPVGECTSHTVSPTVIVRSTEASPSLRVTVRAPLATSTASPLSTSGQASEDTAPDSSWSAAASMGAGGEGEGEDDHRELRVTPM